MNDTIIKYSPWSISKLTVADTCGLRFKWQYIEKRKQKKTKDPRGRVGSAAHKILELLLRGTDDYSRAIKIAAIDNKLTTPEIELLMEHGDNIKKFITRIDNFKKKHDVVRQEVEGRFALTRDMKPTKFFDNNSLVRGVFDYVLYLENQSLIIIDHKTGQPEDIEKHRDQLNEYALAGLILNPKAAGVQCAIHYTVDGSIVWDKYLKRDKLTSLKDWFFSFLDNKTKTIQGNSFEAQKNWLCNFCGYQESGCPLWEEELNGEKAEKLND